MNSFRIGKLSTVGGHGKVGVSIGGKLRSGHLHSSVPGIMTPVLVHLVGGEFTADSLGSCVGGVSGGHDPTCGNSLGTTCSLRQTS